MCLQPHQLETVYLPELMKWKYLLEQTGDMVDGKVIIWVKLLRACILDIINLKH